MLCVPGATQATNPARRGSAASTFTAGGAADGSDLDAPLARRQLGDARPGVALFFHDGGCERLALRAPIVHLAQEGLKSLRGAGRVPELRVGHAQIVGEPVSIVLPELAVDGLPQPDGLGECPLAVPIRAPP